jgi:hypothetical protein
MLPKRVTFSVVSDGSFDTPVYVNNMKEDIPHSKRGNHSRGFPLFQTLISGFDSLPGNRTDV